MAFVSDTEAWAVGNNGYIAHWNGYTWTRVESPTDKNLNAVTFLSPDDGWIAGEGGQILHWDGNRWSVAREFEAPLSDSGAFLTWNAIKFSGPDDGWAVGYWSTEGGLWSDVMHWNGAAWGEPPIAPPLCEDCFLRDVAALSSQDVWAVGEGFSGGWTLHWDGSRWTTVPNPFDLSDFGRYLFHSISALSPNDIWVAGIWLGGVGWDDKGLVIHWNGVEWTDMQLPETGWVNSVLMLSKDDGWVGGEELLQWNGHGWERATKPTVEWDRIVDIEKSPNGETWALTEYGAFLHLVVSE